MDLGGTVSESSPAYSELSQSPLTCGVKQQDDHHDATAHRYEIVHSPSRIPLTGGVGRTVSESSSVNSPTYSELSHSPLTYGAEQRDDHQDATAHPYENVRSLSCIPPAGRVGRTESESSSVNPPVYSELSHSPLTYGIESEEDQQDTTAPVYEDLSLPSCISPPGGVGRTISKSSPVNSLTYSELSHSLLTYGAEQRDDHQDATAHPYENVRSLSCIPPAGRVGRTESESSSVNPPVYSEPSHSPLTYGIELEEDQQDTTAPVYEDLSLPSCISPPGGVGGTVSKSSPVNSPTYSELSHSLLTYGAEQRDDRQDATAHPYENVRSLSCIPSAGRVGRTESESSSVNPPVYSELSHSLLIYGVELQDDHQDATADMYENLRLPSCIPPTSGAETQSSHQDLTTESYEDISLLDCQNTSRTPNLSECIRDGSLSDHRDMILSSYSQGSLSDSDNG